MKYVKYSKYVADPFDDLSAEDLLKLLEDFLLESGFNSQYYNFYEMDPDRTMEGLHQALLDLGRDALALLVVLDRLPGTADLHPEPGLIQAQRLS